MKWGMRERDVFNASMYLWGNCERTGGHLKRWEIGVVIDIHRIRGRVRTEELSLHRNVVDCINHVERVHEN